MIDFDGKILVVVDMEEGYEVEMNDDQVLVVQSLVQEARQAGSLIIFLVMFDDGPLPCLLELVSGYGNYVEQVKARHDGSAEVMEVCGEEAESASFVFCGVDLNTCVARTVERLAEKLPEASIEVVKEGCSSSDDNDWGDFPEGENITVVSLESGD